MLDQPARGSALHVSSIPRVTLLSLIRSAILAPSGHNTQPWRFRIAEDAIHVFADLTRRLPVVDPDDHALFISLGCAIENLTIAAVEAGLRCVVEWDDRSVTAGDTLVRIARIRLHPTPRIDTDPQLQAAIAERQSTRRPFSAAPIPQEHLNVLSAMCDESRPPVAVRLLTAARDRTLIEEFLAEGNRHQFGDMAFRRELASWVRFTKREVEARRDGLSAESLGLPWMPASLGRLAFHRLVSAESQARSAVRAARTASALALFIATDHHPVPWLTLGRAFERFALRTTALGLRHAHLNMPCEVPGVRAQLKTALGLDGHAEPLLLVRVGYAEPMPRSYRRSIADVLLPSPDAGDAW